MRPLTFILMLAMSGAILHAEPKGKGAAPHPDFAAEFKAADRNGDGEISGGNELRDMRIKMHRPLLDHPQIKKLRGQMILPDGAEKPVTLRDAINDLIADCDPDADKSGAISEEELVDCLTNLLIERDGLIDRAENVKLPEKLGPAVGINPFAGAGRGNERDFRDREIDRMQERRIRERNEEERERLERRIRELEEERRREFAARQAELERQQEIERTSVVPDPKPDPDDRDVPRPQPKEPVREKPDNVNRRPVVDDFSNGPGRMERPEPRRETRPEPVRQERRPEPVRQEKRPEPVRQERRPEPVRQEKRPEPKPERRPDPPARSQPKAERKPEPQVSPSAKRK